MNSIKRKRGPKPSGEVKVVFYARVTPEVYERLRAIVDGEDKPLGHAAPADKRISEVVSRPLPVPVEAFKPNYLKPIPSPTPKPQTPANRKETPKKALPELERPNYFKK